MVFDEELGLAYEGYNAELIRAFLILVHYTDLDNPEDRYTAYNAIASHGLWDKIMAIVDEDMADVDNICMRLESSARRTFDRKHSMDYRLGKTFASLLGTEDLIR